MLSDLVLLVRTVSSVVFLVVKVMMTQNHVPSAGSRLRSKSRMVAIPSNIPFTLNIFYCGRPSRLISVFTGPPICLSNAILTG